LLGAIAAAGCVAPAAAPAGGTETISVISITTATHRIDRDPQGTSAGDTVDSRDRLVDARSQFGLARGARIGNDHGRFAYTSTHSASYTGAASLPGGSLTVRGVVLVRADGRLMIPVAGGSGRFTGATGFVIIGPGKTRALNTYELTLPGGA
jgi:hypothetical protein